MFEAFRGVQGFQLLGVFGAFVVGQCLALGNTKQANPWEGQPGPGVSNIRQRRRSSEPWANEQLDAALQCGTLTSYQHQTSHLWHDTRLQCSPVKWGSQYEKACLLENLILFSISVLHLYVSTVWICSKIYELPTCSILRHRRRAAQWKGQRSNSSVKNVKLKMVWSFGEGNVKSRDEKLLYFNVRWIILLGKH